MCSLIDFHYVFSPVSFDDNHARVKQLYSAARCHMTILGTVCIQCPRTKSANGNAHVMRLFYGFFSAKKTTKMLVNSSFEM